MTQESINKLVNHLQKIKQTGLSIKQYQVVNNLNDRFIYNKINEFKNIKDNSIKESNKIVLDLYNEVKKINNASSDVDIKDSYSETKVIRNEEGKITSYTFEIKIRDKAPLTGSFTRDEMSLVYRLYSSYGSNITQREVSRFFPEYSLFDFKRILRAFNITKASSPFPQHMNEELTNQELLDIQFREKENDFLRSYESDKIRQIELQLKKYMKENYDLKEQLSTFGGMLSSLDLTYTPDSTIRGYSSTTSDLFIWLSDMHVGAAVSEKSIYNNKYDALEIRKRLSKIVEQFKGQSFDNIIVCNCGDSLDGYNAQTTRGGHILPQNMNNKEQVKCFIEEMYRFFVNLQQLDHNKIKYYAIGESNHGGDFEYAAQLGLSNILNTINIETKVFDNFMGVFTHKDINFLISHGKDNQDMFKNWPLVINDKTENYINAYLDSINIHKAIVVKGDLHQSATSYAKRFTYKSVGSLFGSSEWIMKNFGMTRPCCDYSILTDGNLLDGRIIY